jgi:hypothetical protein
MKAISLLRSSWILYPGKGILRSAWITLAIYGSPLAAQNSETAQPGSYYVHVTPYGGTGWVTASGSSFATSAGSQVEVAHEGVKSILSVGVNFLWIFSEGSHFDRTDLVRGFSFGLKHRIGRTQPNEIGPYLGAAILLTTLDGESSLGLGGRLGIDTSVSPLIVFRIEARCDLSGADYIAYQLVGGVRLSLL